RDRERLQRAERSREAAPPVRAAVAVAQGGRRGGAAARRRLHPRARVRHAAHGRRRAGARPAADDSRGPVAHPGCDPLSDAPARMISRFELHIALRYLRSRRASRLLSLITVIGEGRSGYGLDPDPGGRAVTSFARHFTRGDLTFRTTHPDVEGGIALGTRLASKLTAFPGSIVTLVAPAGAKFNPSLGAYVPKFHRYEVTGIFDTGMYEYDNSYVALDRRVAQRFAGLDTAVTGLEVRLAAPEQAQPFGVALEARLGYPYRALDWQSQNASLFSALKLEKLAMAFVVFLICVVAAFNVVGMLSMVVRDKTREIGILLAMGLRRAAIRRIFLAQGILIGLTGTTLGVEVGLIVGAEHPQGVRRRRRPAAGGAARGRPERATRGVRRRRRRVGGGQEHPAASAGSAGPAHRRGRVARRLPLRRPRARCPGGPAEPQVGLRLSVPSSLAGILRLGERDDAPPDRRTRAAPGALAGGGGAVAGRARGAHDAPARRA